MKRWIVVAVVLVGVLLWWLSRRTGEVGVDERSSQAAQGPVPVGTALREGEAPALRLAARAVVSGQVRDEQGRAIGGATVCAGSWSRLMDARDSESPTCVRSEDDGRYRIEDLWPVPHFVHASAPRFIPGRHRGGAGPRAPVLVTLRGGQEATDIDVVLRGGGVELKGVVQDLSGGVLEGALVHVDEVYARSGADGQFSLWVAPGSVFVAARAEGYAEGSRAGVAPGQWFELHLTPESVLVGRVVRASDHAPLAGASVYAQGDSRWQTVGPAISDADGRFRLAGLMPGSYKLEALHDEAYGMARESAVLGLGETSEPIEIAAHPAYLVEGSVVMDGGDPCQGGRVQLSQKAGTSRGGSIEADGSVHVQGVLPGRYDVVVECNNAVAAAQYPALVIADRPLLGQRWDVQRGGSIRGEIVLPNGEGVPGLWIHAEPQPDPTAPRAQTTGDVRTKSEGGGGFELAGLLPGRYRLRAGSDRYPGPEPPMEVVLTADRDLTGVRVVLPATGALRGTVVDGAGAPVKSVRVELRGASASPSTSTVDDGSFELPRVIAGEYRAVVLAGRQVLGAAEGVPVTIAVGGAETLELVVERREGKIRGRVVDSGGGPVSDAFIEPMCEKDGLGALGGLRMGGFMGDTTDQRLTDQDGRFELEGLGACKYTLLARRRGGGEGSALHVAIDSEVDIRIAEPAQLAGRVRMAGGAAPSQFSVSVRARTIEFRASDSFFRTDGVFRFPEVPAGEYEVLVEAPEGSSTVQTSVAEGGRVDVQVELAGRVTVRGRIVDLETGEGVPGMKVIVAPRGKQQIFVQGELGREGQMTDAQGRFELEGVAAGPAHMTIMPRGMVANGYGFIDRVMEVTGATGGVLELAPIKLSRSRIAEDERPGELGFTTGVGLAVATVSGPAVRAGLQVGDVIVGVDGHAVTGDDGHLFFELTRVKPGTRLSLALARGVSVELTVGPARG